MEIKVIKEKELTIGVVSTQEILIIDVQTALDLIATVSYETGCQAVILPKSALAEAFFQLKTGLAGEVLQKFTNYQMKVAIIGDFSVYPSKSLRDFIYECNRGKHIFFLPDEQAAIAKLAE